MNPSDLSISKTNYNDELENDFNGLFQGSIRTIEETSELGSPLKREIKNDLQRLFI